MTTAPMPVTIVRPKGTFGLNFATSIVLWFVRAWVLMLVLGALLPDLGVSYWQAFLINIVLVQYFAPGSWQVWTKQAEK